MSALFILLLATQSIAASGDLSLVQAAKEKQWESVRSLLQERPDVNAAQPDGTTALAWAAYWDHLETVELLIQAGADVNRANDFGVNPLWLACHNGSAPLVKRLLVAGADATAALWTGETALMTCSRTGTAEAIRLLVARGADPNAREKERGQTALMWAASERHPAVIKALLESGADVSRRSKPVALYTPKISPTYNKNHYLPKEKGGFTPLLFAVQAGDLESVKILLGAGADVNESTPDDGNALVLAAQNAREEVALFLLEKGADPNGADGYGITALHWSMQKGIASMYGKPSETDRFWILKNMPELAGELLARGADPNARIQKEFLPYDIHRFARSRFNDLPQVHLTGATPFLLAAASGEVATMRLLLEAKADPSLGTEEGLTPLMVAAGVGRERERLSEQDRKRVLAATLLTLEQGGDVNAVGPGGRTPLHGAVQLGLTSVIRFLAENGANMEAQDKYGQTPLTVALGDPAQLTFRQLPGGEFDYSFRKARVQKKVAELLLALGAEPYTGPVAARSGQ